MEPLQNTVEQNPSLVDQPEKQARANAGKTSFAAKLSGYDIFISFALGPPPRGTHSYASDLARRLRELDYTVFFSEDEAPVGSQLDSTLRKALLRSHAMVVVANRDMLEDPRWVRTEVLVFRKAHPRRPVIPVFIEEVHKEEALMTKVREWLPHEGNIWVDESAAAVATGIASENAINRLATAPRFWRANRRWRWTVGVVTAFLVVLVALLLRQNLALEKTIRAQIGLRLNVEAQQKGSTESRVIGRLAGYRLSPQTEILSDLGKELFRLSYVEKIISPTMSVNASFGRQDTRIVSLNINGQRQEFDVNTGKEERRWIAPNGLKVIKWAMGCNGASMAFVSLGGLLWLWEEENQVFHQMHEKPEALITSLVFNPDCSILASGSLEGRIQRWDTKTRHLSITSTGYHHSFNDFAASVEAIVFSPDGKFIASGGGDRAVRLWNASTLQEIASPLYGYSSDYHPDPLAPDPVTTVAISPDGTHIVSAGWDNKVYLWSTKSWQPVGQPWDGHNSKLKQVAFSRNGKLLVSLGEDGEVLLWDVAGRLVLTRFKGLPLKEVSLDEDGKRILGLGDSAIWVVNQNEVGSMLEYDPIVGLSFDPTNRHAVTVHKSGWIRLRDAKTLRAKKVNSVQSGLTIPLAFRGDGEQFVTGHSTGEIWLWSTSELERIGRPLQTGHGEVKAVTYSHDGKVLASSGEDGALCFWEAQTGRAIDRVSCEPNNEKPGPINSLAYSPRHGQYLVSGGEDGRVLLRDVGTSKILDRSPMEHTGPVYSVSFSPDGKFIASGSGDGTLRLWDSETGGLVRSTNKLNHRGIGSVSYSFDGASIIAVGGDNVWFWDVQTGNIIKYPIDASPIPGESSWQLTSVAVGPDAMQFVAGGSGFSPMVGPLPHGWPTLLCQKLTHNMSRERWRKLVSPDMDYIEQCPGLPIQPKEPEQQSPFGSD